MLHNRSFRACLTLFVLVLLMTASNALAENNHPHKSASKGRLVSLGTTIVPIIAGGALINSGDNSDDDALMTAGWLTWLGGMTFGPGAGHLYAHNSGRFIGGSAIRGACVTVGLVGAAIAVTSAFDFDGEDDDDLGTGGAIAVLAGGTLWLGYFIYDINRVGKSVREYNQLQDALMFSASPFYRPGDKAVGLHLSMRF